MTGKPCELNTSAQCVRTKLHATAQQPRTLSWHCAQVGERTWLSIFATLAQCYVPPSKLGLDIHIVCHNSIAILPLRNLRL